MLDEQFKLLVLEEIEAAESAEEFKLRLQLLLVVELYRFEDRRKMDLQQHAILQS